MIISNIKKINKKMKSFHAMQKNCKVNLKRFYIWIFACKIKKMK